MAIQDVQTTDTPNSGRAKWNQNDQELNQRVSTLESGSGGTPGVNAYTTLTASFTQPASGANVTATVGNTSWMAAGQELFVAGGGYYAVSSITDATHVVLTNSGYPGNAASGATVASSSKVSPAGLQGPTGPAGSGSATDHGTLTGLADDDHGQYHNDARGDARYPLKTDLASAADATKGATLIGYQQPYAGAIPQNLRMALYRRVSVAEFGAAGFEHVTTGTIASGSLGQITLADATGPDGSFLRVGMGLMVEGAVSNSTGNRLYAEITAISPGAGSTATATISPAATVAVTNATVTVIDTFAIQKAVDAVYGSLGTVELMPGATHVVAGQGAGAVAGYGVELKSNLTVEGKRARVKFPNLTYDYAQMYASDDVDGDAENIVVRNVVFDGNSQNQGGTWYGGVDAVPVYQKHEFKINLRILGAKNMSVEDCDFLNVIGDGVYVGKNQGAGARYCKGVTVRGGKYTANQDNRQAISIVGGESILITGTEMKNQTRSNMPGAIDVEPNGDGVPLKDILITNNRIIWDQTSPWPAPNASGIILTIGDATWTNTRFENVVVSNNVIRGDNTHIYYGVVVWGTALQTEGVLVEGNAIDGGCVVGLGTAKGSKPVMRDNLVKGSTYGAYPRDGSRPHLDANRFLRARRYGVRVDTTAVPTVTRNEIYNCGTDLSGADTAGLSYAGGDGATIRDNTIDADDAINFMNAAMDIVSSTRNRIDGNYVNNGRTYNFRIQTSPQIWGPNNVSGGSTQNSINLANYPPTAGTWATGTRIFHPSPTRSTPSGWLCAAGGTPGTWIPTLGQQLISADRGDASVTLTNTSETMQRFNTALTAARTVTLPNTGLWHGMTFEVWRQAGATGAFNLTVQTSAPTTLATLTAANQYARFVCDGTNWHKLPATEDVSGADHNHDTVPVAVSTSGTVGANTRTELVNCSAGAVTRTLPSPAGASGKRYTFVKYDASANGLTLSGTLRVGGVGVGSVTTSAAGDAITFESDGSAWVVVSPPTGTGGSAGPATMRGFSAYRSANQTVTANTPTKVQLATEDWDTDGWFDSATNYRFQPNLAGYYQVNAAITGSSTTAAFCFLYKNGVVERDLQWSYWPVANNPVAGGGGVVYLNGTTDYLELWGQSGSTALLGGRKSLWMQAHLAGT